MLRAIVLFLATVLATSSGFGDEQECEPITVRESPNLYNVYDGSTEPDMIPDHVKYRIFESMYNVYLDKLVQELSARDHAILDALITEREYWQLSENARYEREILGLCAQWSNMDPVTVAVEYERIAEEFNARGADRTRQAIEALSGEGRQVVEKFIAETITPQLSYPRTNSVDSAKEDPDSITSHMEIMCHTITYGEPPPEIQRVMDCLRQQTAVDPDNDLPRATISLRSIPEH